MDKEKKLSDIRKSEHEATFNAISGFYEELLRVNTDAFVTIGTFSMELHERAKELLYQTHVQFQGLQQGSLKKGLHFIDEAETTIRLRFKDYDDDLDDKLESIENRFANNQKLKEKRQEMALAQYEKRIEPAWNEARAALKGLYVQSDKLIGNGIDNCTQALKLMNDSVNDLHNDFIESRGGFQEVILDFVRRHQLEGVSGSVPQIIEGKVRQVEGKSKQIEMKDE